MLTGNSLVSEGDREWGGGGGLGVKVFEVTEADCTVQEGPDYRAGGTRLEGGTRL